MFCVSESAIVLSCLSIMTLVCPASSGEQANRLDRPPDARLARSTRPLVGTFEPYWHIELGWFVETTATLSVGERSMNI